jgi:hypothetical protein
MLLCWKLFDNRKVHCNALHIELQNNNNCQGSYIQKKKIKEKKCFEQIDIKLTFSYLLVPCVDLVLVPSCLVEIFVGLILLDTVKRWWHLDQI